MPPENPPGELPTLTGVPLNDANSPVHLDFVGRSEELCRQTMHRGGSSVPRERWGAVSRTRIAATKGRPSTPITCGAAGLGALRRSETGTSGSVEQGFPLAHDPALELGHNWSRFVRRRWYSCDHSFPPGPPTTVPS